MTPARKEKTERRSRPAAARARRLRTPAAKPGRPARAKASRATEVSPLVRSRRFQDMQELFPLPSADLPPDVATCMQEIRELETLFEEGNITWSEYCRKLKQLAN